MLERLFTTALTTIQRHQQLFFTGVFTTVIACMLVYQYEHAQKHYSAQASDQFVALITNPEHLQDSANIADFTAKHPHSIYSDLLRLQLAKQFYTQKALDRSAEQLLITMKNTQSTQIRSLAAYRLALISKASDPQKALHYAEKIKSPSMLSLKSLIKAQIFDTLGEKEKAMIELNSILSSNLNQDSQSMLQLLHMEMANRHKLSLSQPHA